MIKSAAVIQILLITYQGTTFAQCPELFIYESEDIYNGRLYGFVKLSTNDIQNSFNLKFKIDTDVVEFAVLPLVGNTSALDATSFAVDNVGSRLRRGLSTYVPFTIQHEPSFTSPKVKEILLNNRIICDTMIYENAPPKSQINDFQITLRNLQKIFQLSQADNFYENSIPDDDKVLCSTCGNEIENDEQRKIFTVLGIIASASAVLEQDPLYSSCPQIFLYQLISNIPNILTGVIKLPSNIIKYPLTIYITMDRKVLALEVLLEQANVSTKDNKIYQIYIKDLNKNPEINTFIPIVVQYQDVDNLPKVQVIQVNSAEICSINTAKPSNNKNQSPTTVPPQIVTSEEILDNRLQPTQSLPVFTSTIWNQPSHNMENEVECGKPAPNTLIFGGKAAYKGQWPWQTAIYWSEESNSVFKCGGSLVTLLHIVTAAHCITDRISDAVVANEIVTIVLGKYDLRATVTGAQYRIVARMARYPSFNKNVLKNDIAMIKLETPAEYSQFVRPVCLPADDAQDDFFKSNFGTVVGWGLTDGYQFSPILKMLEVPIIDNFECVLSNAAFYSKYITSDGTAFCAGNTTGSGSPCNGDSGGGMVTSVNGKWYLRGIVSLSVVKLTYCDPTQYVIFTDVIRKLSWIRSFINNS